MKRWHEEVPLMVRRWRMEIAKHEGMARRSLAPVPPEPDDESCHCYRGPGFMRKRRPYGCSNPRCAICHFEKLYAPKDRYNRKRLAIEFERATSGEE